MKPEETLHPMIMQSIRRYISYGWNNALIQDLIRFRFNVKLSARCLQVIRTDSACTAYCQSHCTLKYKIMLI